MKLSDAIRKGCEVTRPGFGLMFSERRGNAYACALGAAWIGLNQRMPTSPREANIQMMDDIWPCLKMAAPTKPATVGSWDIHSVRHAIIWLNDTPQWPRERVADWLDTLEIDLESTD